MCCMYSFKDCAFGRETCYESSALCDFWQDDCETCEFSCLLAGIKDDE